MRRQGAHPARSPDFLSRLHDGELTAAERAHFESHRAHCGECRHAAAEFEAALSLYRSSQTSPAAPDLASRILRRLQKTPRRRPFGVFYGIDLKWAGAFAAALIATIIGSAIVLRQSPARLPSATAPIPVELQKEQADKWSKDGEQVVARNAQREDAVAAPEPEKTDEKLVAAQGRGYSEETEAKKLEAPAPPANAAAAAPRPAAPPAASRENDAARERQAGSRDALAGRVASPQEPSGGERSSATSAYDVIAAQEAVVAPLRFEITPLDGEGSPPAKLAEPALSPEYRGTEYTLVVSASGEVLDVLPPPDADSSRRSPEKQKVAKLQVPPMLKTLRFEAGDKPRRLLLSLR